MSFEGKTVIVTGAGGGMGRATVEMFLKEGANVVGCDVNTSALSFYESFDRFISFEGDLLDEDHVKHIFKETNDRFGRIDGLANIAGIAQAATPITEVSLEDYNRIMDINMKLAFLMCREAAKYMKEQNQGKIVNIGSVSTTRPRPGLQAYIASKGAIESFTKALALELAEYRINVNVLHPGPADTSMLGGFVKEGADIDASKKTIFENSVPLGRLIQPTDIANGIKYLLSDDANIVTGAVLHVDGGRSI